MFAKTQGYSIDQLGIARVSSLAKEMNPQPFPESDTFPDFMQQLDHVLRCNHSTSGNHV